LAEAEVWGVIGAVAGLGKRIVGVLLVEGACLVGFVGRVLADVLAFDGIPVRAPDTGGLGEGGCVSTGPAGQLDRITLACVTTRSS